MQIRKVALSLLLAGVAAAGAAQAEDLSGTLKSRQYGRLPGRH